MVIAPRATILDTAVADRHQRRDPTCLLAPDGITTCPAPATHRVELAPIVGIPPGPATFACAEHVALWIGHPSVDSIHDLRDETRCVGSDAP